MGPHDRSSPDAARGDGQLPDEGLIHEWLDGQLDTASSAEMEALVARSPEFAARVAEARGLVAAAARILTALDSVPGGVVPGAGELGALPSRVAASGGAGGHSDVAAGGAARRGIPWRRLSSIAAVLMVAATGVVLVQRAPDSSSALGASAEQAATEEAPRAAPSAPSASSAPNASRMRPAGPGAASMAPSAMAAPRPMSSAPQRSATAAKSSASEPAVERRQLAVEPPAVSAAVSPQIAALTRVAPPDSAARAASAADATGQRTAAEPAARARLLGFAGSEAANRAAARAAPGFASADTSAAITSFADVTSDIVPGDRLLAVQRVSCTPRCRQVRVELARDGRLRRWVQSGLVSASPDTAHVTSADVARVERAVGDLVRADLPANVRVNGAQCRSVGSLRESLRVEFEQDGAQRAVLGLPWCSDGTHPMERAADVLEAVATGLFGQP